MMTHYDLVVLGNGPAGVTAAVSANQLGARVALVQQPTPSCFPITNKAIQETTSQIVKQTLQESVADSEKNPVHNPVGSVPDSKKLNRALGGDRLLSLLHAFPSWINQGTVTTLASGNTGDWLQWVDRLRHTAATLEGFLSPGVLTAQGIDVVLEAGQFCRKPRLEVVTPHRRLCGRTYLIAPESRFSVPLIKGLDSVPYWTPEQLFQTQLFQTAQEKTFPKQWVIAGDDPIALVLAQVWARMGVRVTLLVPGQSILPAEDGELAFWIQAQLEADGVRVLTHCSILHTTFLDGQVWLQTDREAIATDGFLVAGSRKPRLDGLQLEAAGVMVLDGFLVLNPYLQTSNPRVYGCGIAAGGYGATNIGDYQADLAVRNGLFWPLWKADYGAIPWAIATDPTLARVGLTENQARRRYGDRIQVFKQDFKGVAKAQIRGETTGFCKLIGTADGKLLGAHVVGPEAEEFIGAIALAIQKGIKLSTLSRYSFVDLSMASILRQAAAQWHTQWHTHPRKTPNPKMGKRLGITKLQTWRMGYFYWRRTGRW